MQLNDEYIDIEGAVKASTDRGLLVTIHTIGEKDAPFGLEEWFPKKQLLVVKDKEVDFDNLSRGDIIAFQLPTRIALDRGLFDD